MKLVEVVVLMGAQCISPVQHSPALTEVAKVQCAVMVEKDTDSGTVTVTPPGAAAEPVVVAVVDRLTAGGVASLDKGETIEPASAPPEAVAPARPPRPQVKAPPKPKQMQARVAREEPAAQAAPDGGKPAQKAKKAETTVKQAGKKKAATAKGTSQCKGGAAPQWYTASDGRKKYRCVRAN